MNELPIGTDDTGSTLLSLQEIQRQAAEWDQKIFGEGVSLETGNPMGSLNNFFGMVEELGELARTIICSNQGRKGYDNPEKRRLDRIDACCDQLIFLMNYASREGFDLQEELNRTWTTIVSKRTLKTWEQHTHEIPQIGDPFPGPTMTCSTVPIQNGQGFAETKEEADVPIRKTMYGDKPNV